MHELIAGLQTTVFEMNLNGLISDREFGILEALTENMTFDSDALELVITLTMTDLENEDVVDCIIARKFYTALMILGADISQVLGNEVVGIDCPF